MKIRYLTIPCICFFALFALFTTSGKNNSPLALKKDILQTDGAVFEKVMSVITHQRCMNCHPSDDYPRQGDDSHYHRFGIQRGIDNRGLAALQCGSCHQEANNLSSGVPGAPHWSLAPISMGWQGLNKADIARALLDPVKNGGRNLSEIEHHLTEDPLVLWVFDPGVDNEGVERQKPPLSKEEWVKAVKEWINQGAPIPTNE